MAACAMAYLDPTTRRRARRLRAEPTDAECLLWWALRDRQCHGHRFRRQHPIGPYIADFVCIEAMLVIEVDGGQHADRDSDKVRDAYLRGHGWRVLRFWNHEVLGNRDGVLAVIVAELEQPPPQPSPTCGGGEREREREREKA
jgi:very-short-patch-repair endonuclease